MPLVTMRCHPRKLTKYATAAAVMTAVAVHPQDVQEQEVCPPVRRPCPTCCGDARRGFGDFGPNHANSRAYGLAIGLLSSCVAGAVRRRAQEDSEIIPRSYPVRSRNGAVDEGAGTEGVVDEGVRGDRHQRAF